MNRTYKLTIIFFLICIVISGCGGVGQNALPEIGKITVGYIPILGYSPFFIALEKGYFEEQGLEVELQSFQSGSFMMPLFATGELDFGGGQPGTEYFNAVNQGLETMIVAGFSQHRKGYGTTPTLVRADLYESGEITQPADLKGAKVAINAPRGIQEYFLYQILSMGELTLDDVEIVTMPFPDMNLALANKAIDVAGIPQPLAASAIKDGTAVVLIESDEVFENPQNGVIYFGKRILEPGNREVGVRLLVAFLKAVRELQGENGYTDENLEILSRWTNIPAPVIGGAVKNYFGPNGELNQPFIEDIMMYFVENGYTEFSESLPREKIIDTSYLEEALDRIGMVEE